MYARIIPHVTEHYHKELDMMWQTNHLLALVDILYMPMKKITKIAF